jgi:hypothetical protein
MPEERKSTSEERLEKAQKALLKTIRVTIEQAKGYIEQAGTDMFEGNDRGAALEINLAVLALGAVIQVLKQLEE